MIKKILWLLLLILLLGLLGYFFKPRQTLHVVQLPLPRYDSPVSVEKALRLRQSTRLFEKSSVSIQELSQLLWSAQGIGNRHGYRTSPSAGALFPIELYVLVRRGEGVYPGFYHYIPNKHHLEISTNSIDEEKLFMASYKQSWVKNAPILIVIASDTNRTAQKYHVKAFQYASMESGHVAQNMMLQSVSLGLGIVGVGAFDEQEIKQIFDIHTLDVMYLICIGHPSK